MNDPKKCNPKKTYKSGSVSLVEGKKKEEKTYKKGKKKHEQVQVNSFFSPFLVLISTFTNMQKEKNCKHNSNLNEEKTESKLKDIT